MNSVRLVRGGDYTLNGYIFMDYAHAAKWLRQPFVNNQYVIELVDVGELCKCRHCDGTGYQQTIKPMGRVKVEAFLQGQDKCDTHS